MGDFTDQSESNPTTLLSNDSPPPSSQTHNPDLSPSPSPLLESQLTLGSHLRKAIRITKLDPTDAWLPISESRNGNACYAAFHTLSYGIGFQALILPVAFTILGWASGITTLTFAFVWQLYTLYLLVNLHESQETRVRYSNYMQLANATFGERLGKMLALVPTIYSSVGTCVALIIIGGPTTKIFFQVVCVSTTCNPETLTMVEWYLVFTCATMLISQLPNLNSIVGISLIGAITAIGYCTVIWLVSVSHGRLQNVSYDSILSDNKVSKIFDVLNALGIISFAFRGHNLEIQATMPSSEKHPSTIPMWKGVKVAYTIIAMCLFPLAIGGYWAYGQLIPSSGMLNALFLFHSQDMPKSVLALTSILVIINALSSFQIYGIPTFNELESMYVTRFRKQCSWWLRVVIRTIFGFTCFFLAVAIPFLASLAGLVGGITLPMTLVYPCFIWLKVKKPKVYSPIWWLNWGLGVLGTCLSGLLIAAGVYVIIDNGIEFKFFKPE